MILTPLMCTVLRDCFEEGIPLWIVLDGIEVVFDDLYTELEMDSLDDDDRENWRQAVAHYWSDLEQEEHYAEVSGV